MRYAITAFEVDGEFYNKGDIVPDTLSSIETVRRNSRDESEAEVEVRPITKSPETIASHVEDPLDSSDVIDGLMMDDKDDSPIIPPPTLTTPDIIANERKGRNTPAPLKKK